MALVPTLVHKNYKKITTVDGANTITSGGYYGFDPRSVPNCCLCLDAAYPSNVTGSNPVTLWKNLSVCLVPLMSVSGTTGVTYDSSTGMTFPSGFLSGKDSTVGNLSTTDFTIFIVVDFVTSNATQILLEKGTSWSLSVSSSNKFNFSYTSSSVTNTDASTTGRLLITIYALRGTSTTIYINGTSGGSTTTVNSTDLGNSNIMNIGSGFEGSIYEILMYTDTFADGVMPATQRQQIEGYLGWKWGISLPSGHTYIGMKPFLVDFRPPDLGNCSVWFDGLDSTTLSNSGATTFKWLDKSGKNNNATRYSGNPGFSTTNLQGVSFSPSDSSADCLVLSTFDNSPSNTSVFVVFSGASFDSAWAGGGKFNALLGALIPAGLSSWSPAYGIGSTTSSDTINQMIITTPYGVGSTGSKFSATVTTFATSTTYIAQYFTGDASPSVSKVYQNGNVNTDSGGSSTNSYHSGSAREMTIGGFGSTTEDQYGFSGTIYEIIIYQGKVFTTAQREMVEGYLAWKWNAAPSLLNPDLPTGHSFSEFPPATVVPYPTPGTY